MGQSGSGSSKRIGTNKKTEEIYVKAKVIKMDEIWFAGIDLGGTTIKLAFINQYGEIQHKWEVPTDKSGDTITVTIAKTIDSKLDELQKPKHIIKYIGMGAPAL